MRLEHLLSGDLRETDNLVTSEENSDTLAGPLSILFVRDIGRLKQKAKSQKLKAAESTSTAGYRHQL